MVMSRGLFRCRSISVHHESQVQKGADICFVSDSPYFSIILYTTMHSVKVLPDSDMGSMVILFFGVRTRGQVSTTGAVLSEGGHCPDHLSGMRGKTL